MIFTAKPDHITPLPTTRSRSRSVRRSDDKDILKVYLEA